MVDKEKIKQLIERGCGDRMDSEQALRDSVIGGGLLEAMGWSFDKGEWTPNVAISFGTTTHHMDYWVGNEESKWVLEAKNPINRIDRDKDVKELLSYMKQKDSQYGFLYNGKELLAFKLGSDLPFYEWSCDRNTEIFEMFSNNRFPTRLDEFIKSKGELARFQTYVKENTETIKSRIISLVANESKISEETVNQYFPFLIGLFSSENQSFQPEMDEYINSTQQSVSYSPVPEIFRRDLLTLSEGRVIVCTSQTKNQENWGVNFLMKYRLWEAEEIADYMADEIKYWALYVSKPESKVLYFAEVSKIINVSDREFRGKHGLPEPDPENRGKKIIEFKNGSLKKIKDPIPSAQGRGGGIRHFVYSSLTNFVKAASVRELEI